MNKGSWIVVGALFLGGASYLMMYLAGKYAPKNSQNIENSLHIKAMAELGSKTKFFPVKDANQDGIFDVIAVQLFPDNIALNDTTQFLPLETPVKVKRLTFYQLQNKRYRRYLDLKPDGIFTLDSKNNPIPLINSINAKNGYQAIISPKGEMSFTLLDSLGNLASDEIMVEWNKAKLKYELKP